MNILRVANIPDNRTGGMSRVIYNTGDLLTEMGHRVDYLFAPGIGAARSRIAARFLTPWRVGAQVAELNRRQGPYDVVEIHEPLSMWCGSRHRWGREFPPVVALSFGLEARSHSVAINYRRIKGLPVSLKQRISPLTLVWQATAGLRSAAAVVCMNNEDRDYLLARGVPEGRVHIAWTGVGSAFLEAGAASPDSDRSGRLLFLGTWIERKGILDLVPAVATALARFPAACLTVAGCQLEEEEVRDAFPPEMRGRIEVIPRVATDDELVRLYRRHQVLILPSIFEGLPLVIQEAAAMKLAVVTTPVCGMKDVIRDGENGIFVGVGAPDQLTAAVSRLLADPGLADRLGEAAHRSAREYPWDRTARGFLAGYEAAVRHRSAGTPSHL
jgi:glycosyltransferase involved in cell wall biosynthesis